MAAESPPDPLVEERALRIIETTIDLAEQGGFEAVRLRDVASHAGVAMGTLYRRFHSKEDLLVAAERLGAEVLDLAPALASAQPGAFLDGDLHLTPKGHVAVAEALAHLSLALGLLRERTGTSVLARVMDDALHQPAVMEAAALGRAMTADRTLVADLVARLDDCDCAGDLTGPGGARDGNVDALDFLLLIGQWGSPCVGPCEADMTGPADVPDGNVDTFDYLLLIGQWGSPAFCP